MAAAHALLEVGEGQELSGPSGLEVRTAREPNRVITYEVPRVKWAAFFEAFSGRYHMSLVTVERLAHDRRSRLKPLPQRLGDIAVEFSEGGCDGVHIFLSSTPRSFRHIAVRAPTHLWLMKNEFGGDEALEVESGDGSATLLRFCSPMLLEMATPS
jgi:hypothetical protein